MRLPVVGWRWAAVDWLMFVSAAALIHRFMFAMVVTATATRFLCTNIISMEGESAIIWLLAEWVHFPGNEQARREVTALFEEQYRVPNVLGLVDCTHVNIFLPPGPQGSQYKNRRKSTHTINVQLVVLECTIKKDFQYNKVMPTFHHWVTDERRFGLTFQTAADARAFDKGVRIAVQELLHGLGGTWPSLNAYKKMYAAPSDEDDEQNIFECLNLPESRSSSETSSNSRRRAEELSQTPILCAITLPSHDEPPKPFDVPYDTDRNNEDVETCSYVHLSATHEYTYPNVGSGIISSERSSPNTKPPLMRRDSGSIKKPPLPDKKPADMFQARLKCRHCHSWYLESANKSGACEFAPDRFKSCVEFCSCLKCARCAVYHCAADAEGDTRTCACSPRGAACVQRWVGLSLLASLVPCLCCYAPLRLLYWLARLAGCAGAHHAPL